MPSCPAGPQLYPPVNRTWPSRSRVAADPARTAVMSPVGVNVQVAGSYSSAAVLQPPAKSTRPSASRIADSPRGPPSLATIEPVQANPGDRGGTGVGIGVGAGGPTATPVAAFHGGGTSAAPPPGCQMGWAYRMSAAATPIASADRSSAAWVPSASIVHQPGVAPRTKRIRP